LLNADRRLWTALQGGRNARMFLKSIIPIFRRSEFRRPPKKLVAVRLDADVFERLQQYGAGYSTRINNVLRVVMSQRRESRAGNPVCRPIFAFSEMEMQVAGLAAMVQKQPATEAIRGIGTG